MYEQPIASWTNASIIGVRYTLNGWLKCIQHVLPIQYRYYKTVKSWGFKLDCFEPCKVGRNSLGRTLELTVSVHKHIRINHRGIKSYWFQACMHCTFSKLKRHGVIPPLQCTPLATITPVATAINDLIIENGKSIILAMGKQHTKKNLSLPFGWLPLLEQFTTSCRYRDFLFSVIREFYSSAPEPKELPSAD